MNEPTVVIVVVLWALLYNTLNPSAQGGLAVSKTVFTIIALLVGALFIVRGSGLLS